MNKKSLLAAAALLLGSSGSAQWQPAGDKIKTPWAEKVDPANVLPEYPRPQMVRSQWVNLNGLWDYAIKPVGAMEPKTMDGTILLPCAVESSLPVVQKRPTRNADLRDHRPRRMNSGTAARSACPPPGKAATCC